MWFRKRNEIADLKATIEAVRRDADRRIEEAADEVREVAYRQYGDAAKRVIDLEDCAAEQERVIEAQHRAVDFVTGMDTPQMRADLEEAGAKWREYRAGRDTVLCRVKQQRGVAS